ncbi:MAG: YigZ family protein [Oscillospiraceae bacterium]|nr:YigZ family protein [Oscillospiraceae bacterium]MBQ6902786.1 YigZ family protein [Oscillospiraceae bacterium]
MTSFKVPARDGIDEFVEKRSRFIGAVRYTKTEEEALAFVAEINEKHKTATHNVYAYSIRENNIMRYSDNGEPQGTAGLPVLDVFRKEEVFDFCCVVTRYFGGTLLGAGGLVRAYSHAAKIGLDAAGIAVMRLWTYGTLSIPYNLFEIVQKALVSLGAKLQSTDYGAEVSVSFLIPSEEFDLVSEKIFDMTSGRVITHRGEDRFMAV